jgi:hypothetical protein
MAITRASGNAFGGNTGTPSAGASFQFPNNITAGGSLLVAWAFDLANSTLTISDNINGAWTVAQSVYLGNIPGTAIIAYKYNSAAGGKPIVTTAGQNFYNSLTICEYLGVQSSSDPAQIPESAVNSSGTPSVPNSGEGVGTSSRLVVGIAGASNTNPTVGSGFFDGGVGGGGNAGYNIDIEDNLAATVSNAFWSSSHGFWLAASVTFLAAATAAVATQGYVPPQWNAPGVGPNPARIGRQFAFMGSTFIKTRRGITAVGSSGGSGGGIGTSGAGSAN